MRNFTIDICTKVRKAYDKQFEIVGALYIKPMNSMQDPFTALHYKCTVTIQNRTCLVQSTSKYQTNLVSNGPFCLVTGI